MVTIPNHERPNDPPSKKGRLNTHQSQSSDNQTEEETHYLNLTNPQQKLTYLKSLCYQCTEDNADVFRNVFQKYLTEIPPEDFVELINETGSNSLSESARVILCEAVNSKALLNNVDSLDNLFGRPEIIKRVAIAARLGDMGARKNLASIFKFFSVENDDVYYEISKKIESTVGEEFITEYIPEGIAEYQAARAHTIEEEAARLYEESLSKGYGFAGFELAKLKIQQKDFTSASRYLVRAFENGMLTASDFMERAKMPEEQQIEFFEARGALGDPRGYYKLAQIYEKNANNTQAIEYYKKSLPFFGHAELKRLKKKFPDLMKDYILPKNSLRAFFKSIVDLYNQEEIKKIWAEINP